MEPLNLRNRSIHAISIILVSIILFLADTAGISSEPRLLKGPTANKTSSRINPIPFIAVTYPLAPKSFPTALLAYIKRVCEEENVPFLLICAIIHRESDWRWWVCGENRDSEGNLLSTDYGLMQLNSIYMNDFIRAYKNHNRSFESYDIVNNPYDNVQIGIRHFASCVRKTGSIRNAIIMYNAGYSRVLSGTIPTKTKKYLAQVLPSNEWWKSERIIYIY